MFEKTSAQLVIAWLFCLGGILASLSNTSLKSNPSGQGFAKNLFESFKEVVYTQLVQAFPESEQIRKLLDEDARKEATYSLLLVSESIPAGSYIIDMGQESQTVNNAQKPYGLLYELLTIYQVPIKWVINPAKVKDGIDFTYNGTDYKGGPFIVLADYRTTQVDAAIADWEAQGVAGHLCLVQPGRL